MKLKSNQILWNISDIPINVSGTNTGDETTATIKTKLGITTLSGSNTGDQTISLTGDITGSGTGSFATTLANITDSGVGTFKKITTNTKGLVTGTATVAQSDITGLLGAGSISNTMLANSAVANLSGTNSGDQTTISGNAGTATTLATARNINGVSFNGSADITINAVDSTDRVASSLVGAANGVAPLGSDSRISSTYLPSYVDDVLEYTNLAGFPVTGETGKIYIALDTNRPYRWSGSTYVLITSGGAVDSVAGRTGVVTLTSTDVGLANVNNTSDANKPISTATQTALNLKAPLASPSFTSNVTLYDSTSTSSLKVSPGYKGTTATDAWVTLDPNGPGGSSGLYVWDSLVCSGPLYSGENKLATENFVTSLGYTTGSGYAPLLNPTFSGTVSGITSAMVGLGNVENTAVSTWAGSSNIATVGTVTSGTWSGTAIAVAKGGTGATDAATARTNLGLGTLATENSTSIFGKNLLINSAFSINQRLVSGTVVLTAGKYGHDRWKAGASGCTYTFAAVNGLTTLTITAGTLIQIVEDVNVPYGTNTLTLSWTGTATGRIVSGSYVASPVSASVSGGATTQVEFSTGTLSLVQLEKSTSPTSFEQRPYSIEFDLCRRYYEAVRGGAVNSYLAIGVVVANTLANVMFQYYPKRRLPVYADFSVVSINGLSTAASAGAGLWALGGAGFTSAMLQVNSAGYPNNVGAVAIVANSVANTGGYMIDVEL